jgi:RNA polymerase sigma-70 factor (subfamily 1)
MNSCDKELLPMFRLAVFGNEIPPGKRKCPMAADAQQDELELIRRYQSGDEEAFRILFKECETVLQHRAERRLVTNLRRRFSVSDVVQEARIIAYQRRSDFEYRGPGSFRNWLLSLVDLEVRRGTKRHAGTAKRALQREISRDMRLDTSEYVGKVTAPSQAALRAERAELVNRALASLPEDYRRIMRLTHVERLSLRDAAGRLGRSREAVKKLYGRAMVAFTRAFKQAGGSGDAG